MEELFSYWLSRIVKAKFKPIGSNSYNMQCFEIKKPFTLVFNKDDVKVLSQYLNERGIYMDEPDKLALRNFIEMIENALKNGR